MPTRRLVLRTATLFLHLFENGPILRHGHGWIGPLVLEGDFVNHAPIAIAALDIRDLRRWSLIANGLLHLGRQLGELKVFG